MALCEKLVLERDLEEMLKGYSVNGTDSEIGFNLTDSRQNYTTCDFQLLEVGDLTTAQVVSITIRINI